MRNKIDKTDKDVRREAILNLRRNAKISMKLYIFLMMLSAALTVWEKQSESDKVIILLLNISFWSAAVGFVVGALSLYVLRNK